MDSNRKCCAHFEALHQRLCFLFVFIALLLLCPTAYSQSWNRAIFRGDEIDPRDYAYNDEYFLNLLSYAYWPDWEDEWAGNSKGYRLTVGSVRSDEFYLHQEAKLHLDVAEKFRFHYDLLQHEDHDTRYLRQRPTFVFPLHEFITPYVFGEGDQLKQDNDIGIGAVIRPDPRHWWEVQYTGVDFNEEKGKMDRHFHGPTHAFLIRNAIPITQELEVGGRLELQHPLTLVDPADDLRFRFKKRLYSAYLQWRTSEETALLFRVSGETTGKENQYTDPATVDHRLNRHTFRSGVEYRFMLEAPFEADWRTGMDYFHFREHTFLPEGGGNSTRISRDEYTLYGGLSCKIWEKGWFRPMLFIDYVSHNRLYPEDETLNDRYNGIQSKLSGAIEIRFTPKVRLVINPNLDLDQMNWGGGNVQFMALF